MSIGWRGISASANAELKKRYEESVYEEETRHLAAACGTNHLVGGRAAVTLVGPIGIV